MKTLSSIVLGFCLLFYLQAIFAFNWMDLWLRPDQQAAELMAKGNPKKAANLFTKPSWQGVANYRAGNYKAAFAKFAENKSSRGYYNQGNALAYMGNYDEAINSYDKALALNPRNADAKFNRDLLKKLKQQQKSYQVPQNHRNQSQNNSQKNQKQKSANAKSKQQNNHQQQHGNKQQQASDQKHDQQAQNHQSQQQHENQNNQSQSTQQSPHYQAEKNKQKMQAKSQPKPETVQQQEQQLARQQWLRRVPDNPGGLLKQIFLRDYLRRQQQKQM